MLKKYIKDFIKDKSVCILGFGREGKSTFETFMQAGGFKSLTVCDLNAVQCDGAAVVTGKDYQKNLDSYDIIMKSPGIVLEEGALKDYSKLSSQTEIFLSVYRDRVIGVTGTKGKSTTSSLIHHVLTRSNKPSVLLGNIGIPPFNGKIGDDDIIVLELSSHQLEYTSVSPRTAVFLNIFPEHLDHYGTFEKYYNAKKNIFLHQTSTDTLIANTSVDFSEAVSKCITFGEGGSIKINPASFEYEGNLFPIDSSCPLLGSHNVNNIAAAYAALLPHAVTREEFFSALATFRPLPHRLEKIGEKDGITYYDDSISTCSETTIQALESLKNVGSVLIGGMDRGIDYTPLENFLLTSSVPHVIFMYDTGKRIISEIKGLNHSFTAHFAENLEQAVQISKRVTAEGSICLLSPGAASYGFFKNFEDRGEQFKHFALG